MPCADFLRAFFVDLLVALAFLPAADLLAGLLAVLLAVLFAALLDDLEAVDFFVVVFFLVVFLAGDFLERFELDFADFLAPDFLAFFVAMVCLSLPQSDGLREEELILPG